MIIQTPELIEQKNADARSRIGKHILIGMSCPYGGGLGKTFNPRYHAEHQWSWQVAEDDFHLIAAAIGDFGDCMVVKAAISAHEQFLTEMVGADQITCNALAKNMARAFVQTRENSIQNLAVDLVLYDVRKNRFWHLNDRGQLYTLSDFVVVGADSYQPSLDIREIRKIAPLAAAAMFEESADVKDRNAARELTMRMVKFTEGLGKDAAIKYLVEKMIQSPYAKRDSTITAQLVKEALLKFDPPSQSEQFEIVVMEHHPNKQGVYFNKILEIPPETRLERALRFSIPDSVYQTDQSETRK